MFVNATLHIPGKSSATYTPFAMPQPAACKPSPNCVTGSDAHDNASTVLGPDETIATANTAVKTVTTAKITTFANCHNITALV